MEPSKQQLRSEIAKIRKALDSGWIASASCQIVATAQTLPSFQKAGRVALYMSIDGEVDLSSLFEACQAMGKHVCIPVFNKHKNLYEFAEITASTIFRTGNYGIREPISPSLVPIRTIDLIFVPGVAFDRKGHRLGRGGGYYDRILAQYRGNTIGIAFKLQIRPVIPCDPHDIPVQAVVTESEMVNVFNEH